MREWHRRRAADGQTDEGHRGTFPRYQHPSQQRLCADQLKETGGHQSAGGTVRFAAPEHVERPVAEFNELSIVVDCDR